MRRGRRSTRGCCCRADGFPTQHLRTIALWRSLHETLGEIRTIELVGEEWHAYVRYHERLMYGERPAPADAEDPSDASGHRLSAGQPRREPRRDAPPQRNVIYGMVTVEGDAVKSSNGRPPLVDGVLERLPPRRGCGSLRRAAKDASHRARWRRW